jgi:hypothetical protein
MYIYKEINVDEYGIYFTGKIFKNYYFQECKAQLKIIIFKKKKKSWSVEQNRFHIQLQGIEFSVYYNFFAEKVGTSLYPI